MMPVVSTSAMPLTSAVMIFLVTPDTPGCGKTPGEVAARVHGRVGVKLVIR